MNFLQIKERLKSLSLIVVEVIQLTSSIITILVATVGVAFFSWILRFQSLLWPLIYFASGLLVSLIIYFLTYSRSARSRWLLQGYRWLQVEYQYHIHNDDPSHHTQTITILLQAIRSGIDHFENRYFWTAQGQEDTPTILSPGHSLMGPVIQHGGWKHYYVHFGHELTKGEKVEVKIRQELYDHDGKFEPFLAKTMSEPVNRLSLKVVLSSTIHPLHIDCTEEKGAVPFNNLVKKLSCKINFDGENQIISLDVPHPTLGHRYEIRWGRFLYP